MAIVWIDGFDHYTAAQSGRKYNSGSFGTLTTGRYGGQAITLGSPSDSVEKIFASTSQAWRVGFAVRLNVWPNNNIVFSIRDGGSNQVELGFSSTRQIRITRNGTQLGVSTATLDLNTWYYIEWYVVIVDSLGTNGCVVKLNGTEAVNLSAATDTKNTTNAFADRIVFNGSGSSSLNFDDLVVSQEAVTTSPTFLGERRVLTIYPNGNGTYSQFTGSDGNSTDNYQLVDEAQNSDSDYVTSETTGHKDSYAFENLTFTPTSIEAVQVCATMRKDDAGARTGRLFIRSSNTDYEGSDIAVSSSYRIETHLTLTDPATGAAWTQSGLNALEAGVKVQV